MTSEPFLRPKLTGDRFKGGVIPLEVLSDLAVLSEMIVEVAKWRYRETNPQRRRVPRGFTENISLKLTGVEDGSAVPVISLFIAATTLFPAEESYPYLMESREAIVGAVRAAEANGKITDHLPEKLLGYFDRFGRHLLDGESIDLPDSSGGPAARLTKETRRRLLLASSAEEITEEASIHGLVHEFNQRAKTFQMTLPDGTILSGIPVESQHYDTVLEASNGFRLGVRVRVAGVIRFNRSNRIQAVEKVEHVTTLDPLDIRVRLAELKLLKAGWLDGEGLPPPPEGLEWLASAFDAFYPEDLPLPYLYPTLRGGVRAEWSISPFEISLDIDLQTRSGEWHSLNLKKDAEKAEELSLGDAAHWEWIAKQIREAAGVHS